MIPILTPDEMGAVDAAAPESVEVLIGRAGRAVARAALRQLGGAYGRRVVVVAGKGNNGADGRVAATALRRAGILVEVIDAGAESMLLARTTAHPHVDLVIDAAYGTGFRGTWTPPIVGDTPVLAVDIPSGLDASTGTAAGDVLRADRTVTFQALKPGLLFAEGRHRSGVIDVADIGLDLGPANSSVSYVERSDVATWWPRRTADDHKWRHAVRVVAGSEGMHGAAVLAASAAVRAGASLVTLSVPGADPSTVHTPPEVIVRPLRRAAWATEALEASDRYRSLVVGPGLGRGDGTADAVRELLASSSCPAVVDGDGLRAFSRGAIARPAGAISVLTPHDGEFDVLTGAPPGADRIGAARRLASALDCVVLLKGPATVIASPTGDVLVADQGDERLATAGSGDVLAGLIGAVLAVGRPADLAQAHRLVAAAAWVHGEAAQVAPRSGLSASDLGDLVALVVDRLDR